MNKKRQCKGVSMLRHIEWGTRLLGHKFNALVYLSLFLGLGVNQAHGQWVLTMNGAAQMEPANSSTSNPSFEWVMNPFVLNQADVVPTPSVLFLPFVSRVGSFVGTSLDDGAYGLPTTYSLGQNYPNPFNPTTIIRYELPIASRVTLEVFDVLGRRVSTLVDAQQAAGRHEVLFDASSLSSGQYLVRIQAGSFVEVRAITLMK